MRNDSVLSTGLSSAASRRLEAKRIEQTKAKQDVRHQLTPAAEIILEWIEQEKKDVANLEKMVLNIESEEKIMAQLLAKKMHLDFLNSLSAKAKNVLRTAKAKEASDE